MFKLYNRPAIDDAITSGKQLRFSHDPRKYHDCALGWVLVCHYKMKMSWKTKFLMRQ